MDFQSFLIEELGRTKLSFRNDLQIEVGVKIKELRATKGFSQKQLSELSGISQSKISQIENGLVNLTLQTMETIFSVMGYKVHILEEKNDK